MQFIETLNVCHPTIKFTGEWSKEEINFLDVNIRLRNRQLKTDLHIKPTDTHQFLDSTSCHPYHCKKGIPYSHAFIKRLINAGTTYRNGWWKGAIVKESLGRRYSKQEVNLGIAFFNEGIPETLRVNSLLTSLTIQRFRTSEAYCRNFKFY